MEAIKPPHGVVVELELVSVESLAQDESLMNSGLFLLDLQTPAEDGVAEGSAV